MALTDAGKAFIMNNDMGDAEVYVALSANGSEEQSGQGYIRAILPEDRAISANGMLTLSQPLIVYTPNAPGAPDSTHAALFDAADEGNRLTEWEELSGDIPAPADGQPFRLSTFTMNPFP